MAPVADVVICANPVFPHLAPIFEGLEDSLRASGHGFLRLPTFEALLARPELIAQASVILGFGSMRIDAALMERAPRLRGIVSCVSGTDGFDLAAATARGIAVGHAPTPENFRGMAESAVMLMLTLLHDLDGTREAMHSNAPRPHPLKARMLHGKTVGLVGWGRISAMTAQLLQGWGVDLRVYSRRGGDIGLPAHARAQDLAGLMADSDIVCVLAGARAGEPPLVGAAEIARMKPEACLMNLSRGATVDERAVAQALREGRIAGAALDVFAVEPLPADSPLWNCPGLVLTPHRVGHTREADASMVSTAVDNVAALLRGELPSLLANPHVLPAWQQRWQGRSLQPTPETAP